MGVNFNDVGEKVVSPIKLAHVVLRTNNFDKMNEFYRVFLGGRIQIEVPNMLSFLTYDDEHHRIALIAMPHLGAKDPSHNGLEHIAFTFNNISELFLAYRQRKARGIEPYWSVNHGPTLSLYYRDPDGNALETQIDNFTSDEEANEFMNSPEFLTNPIGVDIDPEEMIARIEKGENLASLRKRPEIGPRDPSSVPGLG